MQKKLHYPLIFYGLSTISKCPEIFKLLIHAIAICINHVHIKNYLYKIKC